MTSSPRPRLRATPLVALASAALLLGAAGQPALGLHAATRYEDYQLPFGPRAVLLLYGSAVLGALNAAGEQATPERLGQIVRVTLGESENSLESAFQQIDRRLTEIAGYDGFATRRPAAAPAIAPRPGTD